MGGIGASFAVLAGPEEEEEGDPGEIADGDVYWVGSLGGGVQVLNDVNREGPHSCRRIIFFLIGHHLASHPKVDFYHAVVAGVVGTHGCEYLTDGVELLLDISLLDGIALYGQKSGTDTLGENSEERNGIFNAFEVRGDLQPAAEALPLAPGV